VVIFCLYHICLQSSYLETGPLTACSLPSLDREH